MTTPASHAISTGLEHSDIPSAIFHHEVVGRPLPFIAGQRWRTDERQMPEKLDGWTTIAYEGWEGLRGTAVWKRNGSVLFARVDVDGEVYASLAGSVRARSRDFDVLRDHLKPKPAPPESAVELEFWMQTAMGPRSIRREIATPGWWEIQWNYPYACREALGDLMTDFRPRSGGQLLLWHGVPGTGKTFAIRALARSWREWGRAVYITDPEEFFGGAAYMLHVLLNLEESFGDERNKWRLLIIEDAGELLSMDARERTGQGLSRLLNVTDGLIGQGLKVLILITTNEDLGALHPAVTRAGRCVSNIEFTALSPTETREWCRRHDEDAPRGVALTLADAFALVEGRVASRRRSDRVGFGA